MAVFKRGNKYWFSFYWNGQRIQKSTKQGDKSVARTIQAAYRTALAKGEVGIMERKSAPRFCAAMEKFLKWSETEHAAHPGTHRRYETSSKALLRHFVDVPLERISPGDVEDFKTKRAREWKISRRKAPASGKSEDETRPRKEPPTRRVLRPATVNRELACLKALFNYAIKQEWLAGNPVRGVKFLDEDNDHTRAIGFEEQRRYLAQASQPLRDIATVLVETGMRPEEVFQMTVSNVHLNEGFVFNPHGKTKAAKRRVPFSKPAAEVLRKRLDTVSGPYLFPSAVKPEEPVKSLQNAHAGAVKRSGVRPFRLYDLRHTFATRAVESGMDLVTLAAILGHSRLQMVLRYGKPSDAHKADSIKKLEEFTARQRIAEYEARNGRQVTAAVQ